MPGPRYWHRRRHRSLRGRLAWAFVMVSAITLLAALGASYRARLEPGPFNLRMPLVALPVAALAGGLTATWITRRLSRLRAAVERIDLRDLSLRVPVEGEDEVAALARSFNRMVDRLEAVERARRQLFADVAHELRHPLAVLKGRLELMQDGVVALDAEQVLYLQEMVITLTRLVGDLRDLSLAEVGRLSLNLAPLRLGELIDDLVEFMEPAATEKGISLTAAVAPDLPEPPADADRLRQVLVNLLTNALQHTPSGGQVTVRAYGQGQQLLLEVLDTGPGIAAADLPHIFDRFYRAGAARDRATGGSGLGLAIVRSLVELHGGSVRADARPGGGSRFTVALPLAP